jgi:hypothetical protein
VHFAVIYGDHDNHDAKIRFKYNGRMPVIETTDKRKIDIIISILISILSPTLFDNSSNNNGFLRTSNSQKYVMDKKWQCVNFNMSDYVDVADDNYKYSSLKSYSVSNVIDMYRGGIIIDIGDNSDYHTNGYNLLELESNLDEALIDILPTLDYEEVIWDLSRGLRTFDTKRPFHDYTLKILLNI